MTDEPSFPADTQVGSTPPRDETSSANCGQDQKRKRQKVGAGVAVGIGSAAIVAALLYANRGRRNDRKDNE